MTPEQQRQRMLEVLNETVEYYSEDTSRRAVVRVGSSRTCEYLTSDGRMCAVGRCIIDPENVPSVGDGNNTFYFGVKDRITFKPEYQGLPDDFWAELQELHDSESCWDESGITSYGKEVMYDLCDRFLLRGI